MQAPLVAENGYQGVVGNFDCVRLRSSELVEAMEPQLVSIGKVAVEFNLATSGSDDVLDVGKSDILTTGDDAIFHALSKLGMSLITQGLSCLVNESKDKNVNQGINVALGNVITLARC